MTEPAPIKELLDTLPQGGRVEWIGTRPSRYEQMKSLDHVQLQPGRGLEGDHFSGGAKSTRQVTLIQMEHLQVVASCLHREFISPSDVRRNIVVSGINLLALKNKTFCLGEAVLEYTGPCHPCSRMEQQLGKGGYNAMRGHGGITARVCEAGKVHIGDEVSYIKDNSDQG